jgi:hypothetical protein
VTSETNDYMCSASDPRYVLVMCHRPPHTDDRHRGFNGFGPVLHDDSPVTELEVQWTDRDALRDLGITIAALRASFGHES